MNAAEPLVRPFRPDQDMDAVLDIWVRASEQAHAFVPPGFWRARLTEMRDRYLPLAEVRVAVWPDVAGFAAVVEDHLAALFVAPERQGRGLGRLLVENARQGRAETADDAAAREQECEYGKRDVQIIRDDKQSVNFDKYKQL